MGITFSLPLLIEILTALDANLGIPGFDLRHNVHVALIICRYFLIQQVQQEASELTFIRILASLRVAKRSSPGKVMTNMNKNSWISGMVNLRFEI